MNIALQYDYTMAMLQRKKEWLSGLRGNRDTAVERRAPGG
jgi:hypothetical protein